MAVSILDLTPMDRNVSKVSLTGELNSGVAYGEGGFKVVAEHEVVLQCFESTLRSGTEERCCVFLPQGDVIWSLRVETRFSPVT